MHLSTFLNYKFRKVGVLFLLQVYENMMKIQLSLNFLYFQMDKKLICINAF